MSTTAASGADAAAARKRAYRWALVAGATVMVALALVLLFLLAQATNNRELYERNYARLVVLNAVVAVLLLGVILWAAIRLALRLRRGSSAAACWSNWRPSSRWWGSCRAC